MITQYSPTDTESDRIYDQNSDSHLICPYCGCVEDPRDTQMNVDIFKNAEEIFTNKCRLCGKDYIGMTCVRYEFACCKKDQPDEEQEK